MHAAAAVGAELEAEEAAALDGLHDHRAGAVAEQDERRAVVPVEDLREDVAADHERLAREAGCEHPVGLRDRVHEAGAAGEQVVRGGILGIPSASAISADDVGNIMSGVTVAQMRRSISAAVGARVVERGPRGGQRDVGERLVLGRHAPLADPRALDDPLVGGVDVAAPGRRS